MLDQPRVASKDAPPRKSRVFRQARPCPPAQPKDHRPPPRQDWPLLRTKHLIPHIAAQPSIQTWDILFERYHSQAATSLLLSRYRYRWSFVIPPHSECSSFETKGPALCHRPQATSQSGSSRIQVPPSEHRHDWGDAHTPTSPAGVLQNLPRCPPFHSPCHAQMPQPHRHWDKRQALQDQRHLLCAAPQWLNNSQR